MVFTGLRKPLVVAIRPNPKSKRSTNAKQLFILQKRDIYNAKICQRCKERMFSWLTWSACFCYRFLYSGGNAEKSEKSGEIGSIFCATPATNPQTLLFSHQIFSCPISWIFWRPWRCDFWQLPLEVNGLFYGCSWKLFEYVQFIKRNFLLSIFWAGWRP